MTLETVAEHMETNKIEPYITTASGKNFYIDRPEFDAADIAHALANMCRYNGHCKQFYSVAEHSLLVARIAEDLALGDPLEALLHDAAEAYLPDMPAPWKDYLPDFKALEAKVEVPLRQWVGLPEVLSEGIQRADRLALLVEARILMPGRGADWKAPDGIREQADDLHYEIRCFTPQFARGQFWHRLVELLK